MQKNELTNHRCTGHLIVYIWLKLYGYYFVLQALPDKGDAFSSIVLEPMNGEPNINQPISIQMSVSIFLSH